MSRERSRRPTASPAICTHRARSGSTIIRCRPACEEIWRFTPLKRLRGLHLDAPLDGGRFTVEVDAPDEIAGELVSADDPVKGSSGYVPNERISARAYAAADQAYVAPDPKEAVVDRPAFVTLTGTGTDVASSGTP